MSLVHEVPTGLRVRPTVTIRHIPGRAIRLPARAGTLLLVAVLIWGALASLTPIAWITLAGIVLVPASLIAALVELTPRGRTPLAWVYVFTRRARRLLSQFAALGMEPPPRLLHADEIRALLRMALDPVAGESQQQRILAAPRLIQVVEE
jgi:hypothetical protein